MNVDCSRWDVIVERLSYLARMVALLDAPTKVRLLNHPGAQMGINSQRFSVAYDDNENAELQVHNNALSWIIVN